MSITPQISRRRPSSLLRALSLILAFLALPPAVALFAYDNYLEVITHPTCSCGPFPAALIPLPITGWQALALHIGPSVLLIPPIIAIVLDLTGRWLARNSSSKWESPLSPLEARWRPLARKLLLWSFPTWLALIPVALVLLAPMPPGWLYDTGGTTFLGSVSMVSPNDGWAVGSFLKNVGGFSEVIWHDQNGRWAPVSTSPAQVDLRGVAALPDGEAWAVGSDGAILHEREGQWTQVESTTTDDLESVAMLSPTEGWAVGGADDVPVALVNHAIASRGAVHPSFSRQDLRPGISTRQSDHITCRILHYTQGQWRPTACPTSRPLLSVCVLPDGEAWAVGMAGIILHEQQGIWTQVPSPSPNGLNSVALASPTDGWAVGDWGTILHDQNGTWTPVPALTSSILDSIAVAASGEGWILGDQSTMLHESKGSWELVPSPTEGVFFGVTLLPDGQEGWAVGADHLILHYHNGSWSVSSREASA